MKNNKSEVDPLHVIIGAAILGIVLWVFIAGVIPIFTGKQVPYAKAQQELVSQDCDNDGIIGLTDKCPCIEKADNSETQKCGVPDAAAAKSCPALCKK